MGTLFLLLSIFSFNAFADDGAKCSSLFLNLKLQEKPQEKIEPQFENGHNIPLRNVMRKMQEYEDSIREFVDALTPKVESKYIKDRSAEFRNIEKLNEILEIAQKYEKILNHLVEHSDHMMMSPRIQMIPAEKRAAFIQGYKQSYINYFETFRQLVLSLEILKDQDPASWNNQALKDLLMNMHSQMGAAHNKF